MKKRFVLPYNLQFFAEGENVVEPADPPTEEIEEVQTDAELGSEDVSEPEVVQSAEDNAKFAAARRDAESQLRLYMEQQQTVDTEFEKRFAGYKNPITGKPVRTPRDYLDALDAQERLATNEKLKENGIDPAIIEAAINNNPVVRQAQDILQKNQLDQAERSMQEDIAEITKLDAEIKSIDDLEKQPYASEIVRLINSGLGLLEAYKLANFEKLVNQRSEASKQAAINSAKGKSHLSATDGISNPDGLLDIPEKELANWKLFFPNASMKELKEKYNRNRKK